MEDNNILKVKNVVRSEIFYDNQKVRIPIELENFSGFKHDLSTKTISFILNPDFVKYDRLSKTLFTNDVNHKNFQTVFINANPDLKFGYMKSSLVYEGDKLEFVTNEHFIYYALAGILAILLITKRK